MNAILFLLLLLSLTTIFSKGKVAGDLGVALAAPLLILSGYLVSPRGLALLLPSNIDAMIPALRVAIFWVSFLAGLQFFTRLPWASVRLDALRGAMLLIFNGAVLWISFYFYDARPPAWDWQLGAKALILSGIFFYGTDLIAVLLVAFGVSIWTDQAIGLGTLRYFGMSLGFSATMAACVRLIAGKSRQHSPSHLVLLGFIVLGAGVAANSFLNEALVGLLFGALLALFYRPVKIFDADFHSTGAPVLLVLYFFVGVHLRIDFYAFALGAALALFRIFIIRRTTSKSEPIESRLPLPLIAVPLAVSIYLPVSQDLPTTFYLSALTAGLVTTEFMAFWLSPAKRKDEVLHA